MEMKMDMKDMVAALARQPEASRRTMMGDRLQMFAEMPDEERQKAMKMMVSAIYDLPESDMRTIVATRTALLAELPEATRFKLMMTHMQITQEFPEALRMKEMKMVEGAIAGLPPSQKRSMMQAMQAMKSGDMPMGGKMPERTAPPATARPRPVTVPQQAPAWPETLRWITFVLGLWALVSAFIFDYGSGGGATGQAIGGVVAGFFPLINTLYFLAALSGIWLIIAPFIFGYGGAAAVLGILTGIAVTVLAGILTFRRS